MPLQNTTNRRKVSGNRVICFCTLNIPNPDPFNNYPNIMRGPLVFNVRGGALYSRPHFTNEIVENTFPTKKQAVFKSVKLHPTGKPTINIGDIDIRLLRFMEYPDEKLQGLIVRFQHLADSQLDRLNELVTSLPSVVENEISHVQKSLEPRESVIIKENNSSIKHSSFKNK